MPWWLVEECLAHVSSTAAALQVGIGIFHPLVLHKEQGQAYHPTATALPLLLLWLQLSERLIKTRIHVTGEYGKEEGVYEITMVQRLGGRYGE